jgi:sulfatase maturation enzyme AslB (radical SAM superfamily)
VTVTDDRPRTRMLWLDLTRKCQLECAHCYNDSGPRGGHGTMTRDDWIRVVDEAAADGVRHVQLIGGEPTLHPDGLDIAEHALAVGMRVEVFSNLVHVSVEWWDLLGRDGMSLATSYYAKDAGTHNRTTGRPSHRHTRANIRKAVVMGLPLRVGIITTGHEGLEAARRDLEDLGVTRISVDHVRPFGRGADGQAPDVSGLCGACGDGRAAVGPDGTVSPCIMSAWMGVGNAQDEPLAGILAGAPMTQARNTITAGKKDDQGQNPPPNPKPCGPDRWCSPGSPDSGCIPRR